MNVSPFTLRSYPPANARAVQLRHHPIEQCQSRSVRQRQLLQCQPPIVDRNDLISLAFECFLEQPAIHPVIVCDKNFHSSAFVVYLSSSGSKFATACSKSFRASASPNISSARAICSSRWASLAAGVADSPESMPVKAWLVVSTHFVSPRATDSCNSLRRGGNASLKMPNSSHIKSRSFSTLARSSGRFTATCEGRLSSWVIAAPVRLLPIGPLSRF